MIKNLIKSWLPEPLTETLERRVDALRKQRSSHMARWAARSPFTSQLYYTFFSNAFAREQYAVINGRLRYLQESNTSATSRFLLRRNVHRLEKGLLMQPRRDVFALNYIEETVAAYARAARALHEDNAPPDPEELLWAHDVLSSYFEVTASHRIVERARTLFDNTPLLEPYRRTGTARLMPYQRDLLAPLPVDYDAFYELSRRRRSVRWYQNKPVEREKIDKAIAAAVQAPSACNRQPFEFRIFDDPELVADVIQLPSGTAGYAHNVPVAIVIVGRLSAYFSERDRHLIYIDGSLAAMALMYALETLGLSSCPINWPDIEERERRMAGRLRLAPDERPIMLLSAGYPASEGKVAYSHKKPLDVVRSYNRL